MITRSLFFLFPLVVLAIIVRGADAECRASDTRSENLTIATADTWPNMRKSVGSLAFESRRLLQEAEKALSNKSDAVMAFRSVPHRFLQESEDQAYCERLREQTATAPFRFAELQFSSVEALSDWFSEFSQGKGEAGVELYRRCDKSCSPQYRLTIRKREATFVVIPEVICGPARDKNDNSYELSVEPADCQASSSE